jgi:exosortase A-associated hydrolase 2
VNTQALFLPSDGAAGGQRFCLYHPAQGATARSAIVYVHPFAEEMNKSRRMAALQSRAFAQAGHAVLQIDLLGCGDSSGDFGDARWSDWLDDVAQACRWLQSQAQAPLWLWGLRAGSLLAADAARQLDNVHGLLLWQPATSGKLVLQQFLRLKLASDMLGGQAKGAMESLRAQLAAGQSVDVAGYRLHAALASSLEEASLPPSGHVRHIEWIELASRTPASLMPASAAKLAQWTQAGCVARSQVVNGPSFWQTTEIEDAPALIDASLAALEQTVTA